MSDRVFRPDRDLLLDYAEFCFYECMPSAGSLSELSSQCVSLPEDQVDKVATPDGPLDPARVVPAYSDGLRPKKRKASFLRKDLPLEHQRAQKQAEVTTETARAAATALRRAEATHADDVYNTITDSREPVSTADIEVAAKEAQQAAEQTTSLVAQAREVAWRAALDQSKETLREVKGDAEAQKKEHEALLKKLSNEKQLEMSTAAAKAAEPFFQQMLRAQKTMAQYQADAKASAATAWALSKEAKALEKQANEDSKAGLAAKAQFGIQAAQEKFREAQAAGRHADAAYKTVDEIGANLPKYQAAGQAAAAAAVVALNPALAPPPMPAAALR